MISHASKASFLHGDVIPTYGEENGKPSFSGTKRGGLYHDGKDIINADINGSPGILRKEFPGAFQDTWEETVKNIYYPKVMAV